MHAVWIKASCCPPWHSCRIADTFILYTIEDGIFMQELGNFFIGKSFGRKKQKENAPRSLLERFDQVGDYLFSRAVSSELSWARVSLTSVFGMGTGGTSPSSSPTIWLTKYNTLLCSCPVFLRRTCLQNWIITATSRWLEILKRIVVKPSTY